MGDRRDELPAWLQAVLLVGLAVAVVGGTTAIGRWREARDGAMPPPMTAEQEAVVEAGWRCINRIKRWCTSVGCTAERPDVEGRPGWVQVAVPGPIGAYDARVLARRAHTLASWSEASIEVLDGSGMVVARCDAGGVRN